MAKMKENLSDIFSGVNKELLNSTKDKFNKLSSVEKKNVIDNIFENDNTKISIKRYSFDIRT